MYTYLNADCTMQVILPTESKRAFIDLFLLKESYEHANISACKGKVFLNGYAYQFNEEDNPHGLSAVKVSFLARQSIHDYMLSRDNDFILQDVCKELKIKRLIVYGKNENEGTEEAIQYDHKGKFVYESRDLYPDPFFDCYLSPSERLNDSEECM